MLQTKPPHNNKHRTTLLSSNESVTVSQAPATVAAFACSELVIAQHQQHCRQHRWPVLLMQHDVPHQQCFDVTAALSAPFSADLVGYAWCTPLQAELHARVLACI
ncbi:unnamed protein product [Ceratitis capitata]|uniref:(Mediterranean fruit fly) hypothetical protein n=1 Tax=Ceratitis capitata TaxID=7213 RepID=A0A811VL85_CERCA|nr:unnamed protein product [Ceratitis capitata]